MSSTVPCAGCGTDSATVYCAKCADAGKAKCPHGKDMADCNSCMVEGDLAFDAARESSTPTKGRD
jgi:hypothetical protein